MGDMIIYCPLCCKKGFDSKKSLLEHLFSVVNSITCPICDMKYKSLDDLIDHLNSENCEGTTTSVEFIESEIQKNVNSEYIGKTENVLVAIRDNRCDMEGNTTATSIKLTTDNNIEVNKMYGELLRKQLTKPCLQMQELKLVLEDGESRYVVLTNNDSVENHGTDNAVVTKQNHDGTISLTTLKDPKLEPDSNLTVAPDVICETESEDSPMEIYSCNTCGVSFASVIDHIQNFHNDQDVVVEEPLEEVPDEDATSSKEDAAEKMEETSTADRLPLRRMITETGDIIEAPEVPRNTSDPSSGNSYEIGLEDNNIVKSEATDKNSQMIMKHQPEDEQKTPDIAGKGADDDENSGQYHKVVQQELLTTNGSKVKIYNCISCNLYVPTLAEFKLRPCTTTTNMYSCPHCPVSSKNPKSLCAHMKIHKSKDTIFNLDFECAICGTVFPTSKSLKLHKRMHDPIKSRPLEPPVATSAGAASDDMFLCTVCDKLIPVDYRVVHQNSHSANKINCHVCNKKFPTREYLQMHLNVHKKMVHVGKQDKSLPYTCTFCNRKFARPHEKVKHERIHTGEKPHSCEICGKSFRVSYCLTLHMRTHTGARPYACPHCGKRFKAHSVYNHHLLTHSDVRAYKCPFCPKAFKTSVQLAGHKNSHTKPFSCQQCNRPFASLYAVRVHMASHLKRNSFKFSCALCGASYARSFALKDHVRQAHSKDADAPDAADALSGLKQEEWLTIDEEKVSVQPLQRDINPEMNVLEMNADELIVP